METRADERLFARYKEMSRIVGFDTKKATSPARGYGGVLVPDGKDSNGDVIYKYRG